MATLTQLTTDVRERIGEDTADFFSADEVTRAINLGITTFTAEEPWPWLYTEWSTTLAAAQDELELPANVSYHRAFNLSVTGGSLLRGRILERVEPAAGFRLRFQYTDLTQAPAYYYLTSTTRDSDETLPIVKLVPVPDVAYDVEALYLRVPDELDTGADVPDMPTEFHPAIAAWAAGHLFLKEMEISQKAQEQFQLYFGVLAQARKLLEVQVDENVAWGRDAATTRFRGRGLSVTDRIPLTLGP